MVEKKKNEQKIPRTKRQLVLATIKSYLIITVGCIFYAAGISLFVEAADLFSGGMTGISLILQAVTHIPTGYLYIILNIPMLIIGVIFFGWRFLVSTGYATILSGLLMRLGKHLLNTFVTVGWLAAPQFTDNVMINGVVGGALFGIGIGLIFRMGATTAGTDVIVKLLRRKFRFMKTSMFSLITDIIIITCTLFIPSDGAMNKFDRLFYTVLHVVVFTVVMDFVLYGGNSAMMIFVVTSKEKCENVIGRILKTIDTSATIMEAKGAYTNSEKALIMCVIKPHHYPRLRDAVHEEDEKAFMIVSSAKEIYGEGYLNPDAAEL